MIEIPILDFPELSSVIQKFDDTWKKYSSGEIDDVLTNCRRILEELSSYLRRKGFKKRVETNENGTVKKKTVTDWGKFFQDDLRGDIIGSIYQKMFGFNVRGAHAANILFQSANAYFSIMQTYSIAYYIISRLKERNQSKFLLLMNIDNIQFFQ